MADNVVIPPTGAGDATPSVATEKIGGIDYQKVKQIAGTAASTKAVGLIDDAAFTPGTDAVIPSGLEFDDTSPDSVDEGDVGCQRMSARREAYTQIRDAAGNERGVVVSALGAAAAAGDVAHDGADSGMPLKVGGRAALTARTAVADGDRADLALDAQGRALVEIAGPRDLDVVGNVTLTDTTETTLLAAVASTFIDLLDIILCNTSATAVRVDVRDDTGGTVRMQFYLPAGDTRGATSIRFPQTATNKNWTVKASASVTDLRIYARGRKTK